MSRTPPLLGWLVASVAFGVAIASSWAPTAEQGKSAAGKAPAKKAPGGIIISRETTFLTGPLRKDGSVDYAAALNQRSSQGVTPENNAVVLLIQAAGPKEIDGRIREQFFKMLGIAPLPEKGPYVESFWDYLVRNGPGASGFEKGQTPGVWEKGYEELGRITGRAWTKKDSPMAAAWLEENQKQIDLIVAATNRPRYYFPIVGGDTAGMLIGGMLPPLQTIREAARSLCIRAMFRIAAGESDEAWRDLAACHRLARLEGQATTLVDALAAIAIEGMAIQGDAVLAHEGKLTAEQAQRFAAEFHKFPPVCKMAETMNWGERLFGLDCTLEMANNGLGAIRDLAYSPSHPKGKLVSFADKVAAAMVDWNEPLRMTNQWYDRLGAALSKPTRKERDAAVAQFDRDAKRAASDAKDPRVLLRNIVLTGSLRGALGRQMGHVLIAELLPALSPAIYVQDRITTLDSMVPVIFALAAYRADHRAYPADLAALVPKYLPAIPEDLFSGGPLRYKREDAGYVLYSVGQNGKDDGGRNHSDDRDYDLDCDDIAIRVPAKKK